MLLWNNIYEGGGGKNGRRWKRRLLRMRMDNMDYYNYNNPLLLLWWLRWFWLEGVKIITRKNTFTGPCRDVGAFTQYYPQPSGRKVYFLIKGGLFHFSFLINAARLILFVPYLVRILSIALSIRSSLSSFILSPQRSKRDNWHAEESSSNPERLMPINLMERKRFQFCSSRIHPAW